MRAPTLDAPFAPPSEPDRQVEPRIATVLAIAAAAAVIVAPTLIALTHGWDYRITAMLGACGACGCFALALRTLAAADVAGRLSLESAAASAATLLFIYASDWLDWRPLGIDDALAGLTIGLVLLLAGPTRRALRLAASAPGEASHALTFLVLAPGSLAYLAPFFGRHALEDVAWHSMAQLGSLGLSIALAWAGTAFALRRALYGTALALSALSGLALLVLLDGSGVPPARAAAIGALAGALPSLFVTLAWCASALKRNGRLDGLLAALVAASVASSAVGAWLIAGLVAATTLGVWWWFYRRRGLPLITRGGAPEFRRRQWALSAALTLSFWVVNFTQGFLLSAAASNLTGPMLLAGIGKTGLYRVSDLTFSEALLADQYLWREEPASTQHIAAASPGRLVRLMRTERDRWSGAERVAAVRAREERRPKGVGVVFGPGGEEGLHVAYVYPGSPAKAAGVRRGEVVRAVNGNPVDVFGTGGARTGPRQVGSTRLEFVSPGHERREVAIAWAEYRRPAVSDSKVIDAAGRRVGYVVLHDFDSSAGAEFVNAAVRLREQGVDELVLDLRMNPGGGVDIARDIASAIGGKRLDGATFVRLVHNARHRDSDQAIPFRAPKEGVLSLPRLFVITSGDSCSASEALVNGLAPHMTVVTVGTATCGKPVGMSVVEYGEWSYWVITFRVLNARGEGDYFDGLPPTCPAEDDFGHELGDPAEASLAAALHYIRHGRCPEAPEHRTGNELRVRWNP